MIIEVKITGDNLDELNEIVTEINTKEKINITPLQWVNNLVNNTLANNIRGEIIHAARTMPMEDLKGKMGDYKILRLQRKKGF